MKRRAIPKHTGDRWWPVKGTYGLIRSDGKRTAILACPLCGQNAMLTDHAIAANGEVTPSVVCVADPGCAISTGSGFHEFVTLEDWEETP